MRVLHIVKKVNIMRVKKVSIMRDTMCVDTEGSQVHLCTNRENTTIGVHTLILTFLSFMICVGTQGSRVHLCMK